ncbi:MAG: lysophospholipid acyltransferase family protein [Myxococcota bacterium]
MKKNSDFRASLRLARMAAITSRSLLELRIERTRSDGCPHEAARHGHVWARRLLAALGIEVSVRGAPPPGPHLLLGNHRSYIDILAVLGVRPCGFLAKAEIGSWPIFGTAARLHPTVFVAREDRDSRKRAREGALALLQKGLAFAAFPEGTTCTGPGILPFFPGLFRLAEEYDFRVVPFAIEYEDRADAWVADDPFVGHFLRTFRKPRVRLQLSFGPTLRQRPAEELRRRATDWIRGEVRAAARAMETR